MRGSASSTRRIALTTILPLRRTRHGAACRRFAYRVPFQTRPIAMPPIPVAGIRADQSAVIQRKSTRAGSSHFRSSIIMCASPGGSPHRRHDGGRLPERRQGRKCDRPRHPERGGRRTPLRQLPVQAQRQVEQRAWRFGAKMVRRFFKHRKVHVVAEIVWPQRLRARVRTGALGRTGSSASGLGALRRKSCGDSEKPEGGTGAISAAARTGRVARSRSQTAAPIECPIRIGGAGNCAITCSTSAA